MTPRQALKDIIPQLRSDELAALWIRNLSSDEAIDPKLWDLVPLHRRASVERLTRLAWSTSGKIGSFALIVDARVSGVEELDATIRLLDPIIFPGLAEGEPTYLDRGLEASAPIFEAGKKLQIGILSNLQTIGTLRAALTDMRSEFAGQQPIEEKFLALLTECQERLETLWIGLNFEPAPAFAHEPHPELLRMWMTSFRKELHGS